MGSVETRLAGLLPADAESLDADTLVRHLVTALGGEAATTDPKRYLHEALRDPSHQFSITPESLPYQPLRVAYAYWAGLPMAGKVAQTAQVDPTALLPALGYLMLVDVEDGGADFVYTLYGTRIANASGFDMTGKRLGALPTTTAVQTYFRACYVAVLLRREPLYSAHVAPDDIMIGSWHRLILPMGRDRTVTRMLVCNLPVAHDGTLR